MIRGAVRFAANPRFLLCVGMAWFITNGWSYVMLAAGTYFQIGWMIAVSAAYLAFLWLPISPEKIVTLLIAMALLRVLFPQDQQTLGVLKAWRARLMQHRAGRSREKKTRGENNIQGRDDHDNK